ncbi:MAG: cobaltochelatase subunit CobN, partial [Candidatus Aenigmatarchaeota archaeon]
MKLLFIGYSWGKELINVAEKFEKLNLSLIYPHEIDEEIISQEELVKEIETAEGVVVDLRGGGRAEEVVYESLRKFYENKKIIVVFLGSPRLFSLTKFDKFSLLKIFEKKMDFSKGISEPISIYERIEKVEKIINLAGKFIPIGIFKDAKSYIDALKYLAFPCKENYFNFFKLILNYLGLNYKDTGPPIEFPKYGIYHPIGGIFEDLKGYLTFLEKTKEISKLPKVGILFYGGVHFQQNIGLIKNIIDNFPDIVWIPVFSEGIKNLEAIKKFFFLEGRPFVSAILRLLWFRLNGGPFGGSPEPTLKMLKELGVPVINPVVMYRREIEKWLESDYGLSIPETIGAVIWPEMDGSIEPIPLAGLVEKREKNIKIKELYPLTDRLEKIGNRISSWINLQSKKNEEKRVAIIIYNYPPGEENLGKAAYLDVFKSVENLLKILKKEGYKVEIPSNLNLFKVLEDFGIFNSPRWYSLDKPLSKCFAINSTDWCVRFEKFSNKVKSDVLSTWGPPPGKVMVFEDKILIPCIELGNILIGIQPSRPPLNLEDVKKVAHDKTKPPHHQYIAFYRWLEEVWKADVIIHVGTHGLAEFTKGKEIGMSSDCFPDILIGNVPHLYFYHVCNTSEATIAKRRLYGVMISYNSPPYTCADLYEEYLKLEDYLNEYEEASKIDLARARILEEKIKALAQKLNFSFDTLDEIHDELYRLKRSIIPKGLHVIGEDYGDNELIEFVRVFSRYDRGEIKSLNRLIAESKGLKYEEVLKNFKLLKEIEEEASKVIKVYFENPKFFQKLNFSSNIKNEIESTLKLAIEIGRKFINNQKEIESFILGLQGKFIEPSVGGDVIRTPDALPTGRNIYQFDPNKIPTEAACIRGFEIAQNTLNTYLKTYRTYPKKVGIILWGFETTQTQGETIAQILTYLGVKIVRKYGSWYPQLEVIPLEELRRPRIDCHIITCGFFREMFPNLINLLDRAFNLVANLEEPLEMNFVRKHVLENLEYLKCDEKFKNLEDEKLKKIACGRIFGPPPSEYGTRMLPLVEDSVWEKEEDLAEVFIESMNYLYGENIHGLKLDKIFRESLRRIELVSQIRSSNDYEVTDLDHYYEFLGGLSKAIEIE